VATKSKEKVTVHQIKCMNISPFIDSLAFRMNGKSIVETPTSEEMSQMSDVKMNENAQRNTVHNTMNKSKMDYQKSTAFSATKDQKLTDPVIQPNEPTGP
jgi:hypothetical protein